MSLLDSTILARLQAEFCLSMKALLGGLCQDLDQQYSKIAQSLSLPVAYFRFLGQVIDQKQYIHWKVVGWIEALNDLVYFVDLLQQIQRERNRREFSEQLFAECEEKFFENSYVDELFPNGKPEASGLEPHLRRLCRRLAQEITQESLCFDPRIAMAWCATRSVQRWKVVGQLDQNVERAELQGTVSVGDGNMCYVAPAKIQNALKASHGRVTFDIGPRSTDLLIGRNRVALCAVWGDLLAWSWDQQFPAVAAETSRGPLTIGPTLVYAKDRQPRHVVPTDPKQVARIGRAWKTIRMAWPEGHRILSLLTSRIVPLKAKGVVSFSYRHRPGLSFINCFDRDNLDLIDDLIHENSHHHLNLLLRKHVLYHGDHNQQIFYSPWRRSLRPVRGILHATFTFTMGAILFERLSTFGQRHKAAWRRTGLTKHDLLRARFRCFEEVESVRYSIQDLEHADRHLGWLTGSGRRLVRQLAEAINKVERHIAPHRRAVLASTFGPALRRHVKELQQARQTYGPVRLSKA
jgi:HEXXH motif-containing protein